MKKIILLGALFYIFSMMAAPFIYVTHGEFADVVTVIDVATNEIIATIPVGSTPIDVVINPTGTRAYVTNSGSNNVSVIDTATNTVITSVPVGIGPIGLAITHDGRTVYVANSASNTLTPIDTATNTAGTPIAGFNGPRYITISPNDTTAYVSNAVNDTVVPVDLATGTLGTPILVGDFPAALEITPNGQKVYVTNVAGNSISVIDTATNTVIETILLPASPQNLAISFDGRLVYVTLVNNTLVIINTGTDTIINTIAGVITPQGLAFHPCGNILYIANGDVGTLTPFNVANNTLGTPFPAGPGPLNLAITPIIDVRGQLIRNTFLNKIELVVKLNWHVLPVTNAAFFRIFRDGVVVGQIFAGSRSNTFVVCLSPNFVCHSSSDQITNVELGLFAASGVEIVRIPVN